MSLSTNTTFRIYLEKLGGSDPAKFVGNDGDVFLDPNIPTLKLSDGSTPGGIDIGGGGGIGTDGSVNTTGIITASSFSGSTATFSGNVSVGGTLTYDDVTNVDSIGLITARTGINVLSGIVTSPKLHVDSVGSGITFSEDLVVQGNARVTGILSIGTSSIVLDSTLKTIRGVDEVHIGTANTVILKQKTNGEIQFAHSDGEEVSVGIGTTVSINTTGIITASSFVGDGSGLTGIAVSSSIQTATDFGLQPGTFPYWATKTGNITPPAGEWFANGSNVMRANPVDSNGTDWTAEMTALGTTGTFWYSTDALNWTQTTNTGGWDNLPTWFQFGLEPFRTGDHTGGIYISFSDPASAPGKPLQDGDILQYVADDSVFKPFALTIDGLTDVDTSTVAPTDGQVLVWDNTASQWEPGTASTVGSIDDLSDVDTSTVAPTDGQALVWDNANSQWEPGTVSGGAAAIGDLSDVESSVFAQGYEMQQGSFTNSGEFQTNGSLGLLIDKRSKNSLGGLPMPQHNGSFWFSTSEYGPFTELTINGNVGTTGSFAYSIDFVSRSALDAVLTGSTTVYFHSVNPVGDPSDGQALSWNNTASEWEPRSITSSIQTATDFELQAATGAAPITRTGETSETSGVPSGEVGLGIQGSGYTYWSINPDGLSGTVLDYLVNTASFPIDVDISGVTYTLTGAVDNSTDPNPNVRLDHSAAITLADGTSYTLSLASPLTSPLADGDFLQWVNADSVFKPVQLTAVSTRTLLGIGEYADDTAAGTGGVSSGALYYNTTNSNYVLKT